MFDVPKSRMANLRKPQGLELELGIPDLQSSSISFYIRALVRRQGAAQPYPHEYRRSRVAASPYLEILKTKCRRSKERTCRSLQSNACLRRIRIEMMNMTASFEGDR